MAIQINLSASQYGIPFQGAYFRIVTAAVSRTRDADNRHSDTRDVDFRRYHVAASEIYAQPGENFLAQCYSWVMTQADMAGAQAV